MYDFLGEECFAGHQREACGPPQPQKEHTWQRGQSFRMHLPRLKFMQISLVAECRGPAGVVRVPLAGPEE